MTPAYEMLVSWARPFLGAGVIAFSISARAEKRQSGTLSIPKLFLTPHENCGVLISSRVLLGYLRVNEFHLNGYSSSCRDEEATLELGNAEGNATH